MPRVYPSDSKTYWNCHAFGMTAYVLNDVDEYYRNHVFSAFADCLRGRGTLVIDVREWNGTVQRKRGQPIVSKVSRNRFGHAHVHQCDRT
jgi:hypothetical protein